MISKFKSREIPKDYINHLQLLYGFNDMSFKRVDANQNQLVKLFRQLGADVHITSSVGDGFPDLTVGIGNYTFLVELKDGSKTPSERKLTKAQKKFHETWKGHVCVIKTADEVIDLVNRVRTQAMINNKCRKCSTQNIDNKE